jgi:KaiC/GvpD/RAD55 family RecA-like ATPase
MRVSSGISGFDHLVEGGFEEGTVNLLTGKTGTGKSIFAMQFLYKGAMHGKKGIFITTEDTAETIRKQAKKFNWNISAMENAGMMKIIEIEPFDIDKLSDYMSEQLVNSDAARIVIDSISMFELHTQDAFRLRKALFTLLNQLKKTNKVTLVTSEILEESKGLSRTGVIEFMVDGVIVLQFLGIAKFKRSLMIRKMRLTDHSTDIHPFEIVVDGIEVKTIS